MPFLYTRVKSVLFYHRGKLQKKNVFDDFEEFSQKLLFAEGLHWRQFFKNVYLLNWIQWTFGICVVIKIKVRSETS